MNSKQYTIWNRYRVEFSCVAVSHRTDGTTFYCIEDDGTEHEYRDFLDFRIEDIEEGGLADPIF